MAERIAPDGCRCEAVNTTRAYRSRSRARPGERCRRYAMTDRDGRRLCAWHAGLVLTAARPRRYRALTAAQVRQARAVYRAWLFIGGREAGERLGGAATAYRDDPDVPPTMAQLARVWGVAPSVVCEAAMGRTYAGVPDA